jgi:hypothetical protein
MVAAAALVVALHRLTARQLRLLGSALTAAGIVGLLVLIGWDLITWLGEVPPDLRRYTFQRILFTIGTNPDLPLLQVIAAGAVCWIVGLRRKTRNDSGDTHCPSAAAGDSE